MVGNGLESEPSMFGLQWCPRDPLLKIGDQDLHLAARIPIQYQNRFDAMRFTVRVPHNVETEILYVEEQASVEFVAEKGRKHANDMTIDVSVEITGVPADTPAELLMFAPWSDSEIIKIAGKAGDLRGTIVI